MTRLRRIAYPLRLAGGRLRHRAGSSLLLLLGVAAAAAALAAVLGGSLVAQDDAVARALGAVPPAQRSVAVTYADLGLVRNGVTRPQLEPLVDRTLAGLAPGKPVRAVQLKLLRIGGELVNLAAADDLGRFVRLESGRLPETCTAERCEVLQLGGTGTVPSAPGLRLVRVGTGSLTSSLPFGRLAGANATRTLGESFGVKEPPFIVAEGFDELSTLPELRSLYRTYAWVLPLEARALHPWEIDSFEARAARARSTLRARSLFLNLSAPIDQLAAARESGQVAGRRLLLVGGQAAALLLAFAVLAAAGMRRDVEAVRHRLTWFGARGWQLGLLVGAETVALTLLGAAVGWAIGAGVTAIVADRAGSPAEGVLAHSVLAGSGLGAAAVLAAAAGAVLLLSLVAPVVSLGGRRFTALDAAALGALLAVLLGLARGNADARSLAAEGGTGTLLLLLPSLVTFIVAVAAARLLVPGLRLLERAARRGNVPVRLAALSLARRPGSAAVAVTFLVVSLGLALFAAVYRSTLDEGLSEQAAYAVPRDYTVREDLSPTGLVAPLEAAPLSRYRALGADVTPVLRRTAGSGSGQATVLGVPADAVAELDGWRDDFSPLSRHELVDRIRPERGVSLRGPELPREATTLRLPYTVRGGDVALTAVVATPAGLFARLGLGDTSDARSGELSAPIPKDARGGRIVALELARAFSAEGHGDFARVDGILKLGPLTAAKPLLQSYGAWVGRDGVTATGDRLRFLLTNEAADPRFQPRQATDSSPPPVVATPGIAATAGAGGIVPLRLPGGQVPVRVVGTIRRFPSASGEFVLGDEQALFVAMNATSPGTAVPNELWLGGGPSIGRALERPPFATLAVSSRAALENRLRDDPLARGSLIALAASALVAFLLAVAGLALLLTGDARDERRELTDLEAQGAGPSTLRRHLRLRALLVALLGLLGGLAAAAILSTLVVGLVTLTANASLPEPPLALSVDWLLLAAGCALYLVLAAGLVALSTRRAV